MGEHTGRGATAKRARPWWEPAIIYQVYPGSFQDTDGDGTGDLRGVLERLDHLSWLGIDAIWLSPIYPSPMADFGYDISEFCGVDPRFGTLADLDILIEEVHRRGMRLLLDLVPNHTSDRHPWFEEARSSRTSRRRDWYVWHDGRPDGLPPNNWRAMFGGSAWTWDEPTRQFYYHAFLASQPDLNWRNPEVRAAMADVIRFWLARGVDGFRVDVITHLLEDEQFRDNPPNPTHRPGQPTSAALLPVHTVDHPDLPAIVRQLRAVVNEFEDRLLIGEVYLPLERLVAYYGNGRGLHLPFNFQLLQVPWEAPRIAAAVDAYEALLPPHAWPAWVLGNHDQSRVASRVGNHAAALAAMLLLTLRGTPTIYYGDEIGMADVDVPPARRRDPAWNDGAGTGRDRCRTPMPWDTRPNGGFTTGEPWLPLGPDVAVRNVAAMRADPTSLLTLHRRLIALRRAEPALAIGDYRALAVDGETFTYRRSWAGRASTVALNFGERERTVDLRGRGQIVLATGLDRDGERVSGAVRLRPHEGVVLGP